MYTVYPTPIRPTGPSDLSLFSPPKRSVGRRVRSALAQRSGAGAGRHPPQRAISALQLGLTRPNSNDNTQHILKSVDDVESSQVLHQSIQVKLW